MAKRLVVGVSGASGAPRAVALLRRLQNRADVQTHLVLTCGGELTLRQECGMTAADLSALADVTHDNTDLGAAIASGSFKTLGMVVVPCSMKTAAGIATGYSDNLLLRAVDVTLKERRKLVLVARESPLSTLHLRNLCTVSELGAVVLPPVPAYYRRPRTVEDCTAHTVSRILSQFDLDEEEYQWSGL